MHAFTRTRIAAVGAVSAGILLLAACGGSDSGSGSTHDGHDASASASAPAESPAFNDADVTFAQGMIPHHQQAVEMAELAEGRASDQEIKDLAQRIKGAQDPEIQTLKGWLKDWGKPESSGSGHDHGSGHDMGSGSGMMSDADMAELEDAKGAVFDRAFARLMVEHHDGAIAMAEDERRTGRNADAKQLAAEIIKAQSTEVTQLKKILDRI
ncbi:DUF305 domain-containing protein [Streptomyces pathocidini]|uniref:DUF305 domain-containing protein n=1 Tax=Streptomyces pathocidini TaxID=1650571 RepID=UPI0033D5F7B7